MDKLLNQINVYKCLVKIDNKFVLGEISGSSIFKQGDHTQRVATLQQRTRFKFFTECLRYKSKVNLGLGDKIKYDDGMNWYYVVEEVGVSTEDGSSCFEYVIGK